MHMYVGRVLLVYNFCTADTTELIRLLKDPDIDVQREAVHSLRRHQLNAEQVESVLALTRSSNSFVRRWAWETVVTLPIDLSHIFGMYGVRIVCLG